MAGKNQLGHLLGIPDKRCDSSEILEDLKLAKPLREFMEHKANANACDDASGLDCRLHATKA